VAATGNYTLHVDVLTCHANCRNISHIISLTVYARALTDSCLQAAEKFPHTGQGITTCLPVWNKYVKPERENTILWHNIWVKCNVEPTRRLGGKLMLFMKRLIMAALRSRCQMRTLHFCPLSILAVADWRCLPYFYTWCGLSANLECRSEMCCTGLAGNAGPKNSQNSPSGHHRTTLSGHIFSTKACVGGLSTIGKKLVKQQCLPHVASQYGELRLTNG